MRFQEFCTVATRRQPVELDEFTDLGVSVVQKTWEVLRTFDAYAQARADTAFEGGIFQYQRNPEHGHYMRIRQISAHESDTVQQNQRMREQRTFTVPTEIDPSGQLVIYAHIPLATGRGRSPRLHFEDTWPTNGRRHHRLYRRPPRQQIHKLRGILPWLRPPEINPSPTPKAAR